MFGFAKSIVWEAEQTAADTVSVTDALRQLRKLSLDDFGSLIISLPNDEFPNLSKMLPRMANEAVQKKYTGRSGEDLLRQTLAFVRQVENDFTRYTSKSLFDRNMLDFGCGYGRIIRLMYYFSDPEKIWGVDAEPAPLQICQTDGILANLHQTSHVPQSLPLPPDEFDLVYAFSVFTHLPDYAARACLSALREVIKPEGLFVATFWPIEIWEHFDRAHGTNQRLALTEQHAKNGYAHVPHEVHQDYGMTSLSLDFFKDSGWSVIGYDNSIFDRNQISAILQKK